MDNNLSEELENILNQHGWDAFVDYVGDRIERSWENGYDIGKDDGWCECFDTYEDDIMGEDYDEYDDYE